MCLKYKQFFMSKQHPSVKTVNMFRLENTLLAGYDVDVIRVEGRLDPGCLHPEHLTSERHHPLVITQPPGPEAGAVHREVAASCQVREVFAPTLQQHPTCNDSSNFAE